MRTSITINKSLADSALYAGITAALLLMCHWLYAAPSAELTAVTPASYIVVFNEDVDTDVAIKEIQARFNLPIDFHYRHAIKGLAAYIPPRLLQRLEQDPRVAYIEAPQAMHLHAQTLPTGIDRINAELNATANIDNVDDGVDVDIAIIDSGIDIDHPDLNVWRYIYCFPRNPISSNCAENDARADDSSGHGTHVAGIAAARDNNSGVVGVAPGARIWGIRVAQTDGSMTTREVIAALDYVAAHSGQIEVANISLGFLGSSSALDQAITNTVAAGVTIVVSAGNEALDVSQVSPAGHPEVITVSALADFDGKPGGLRNQGFTYTGPDPDCTENQDDSFACFSNYGSGVDIMAPGTKIRSTYLNGSTAILHGTSMSTPHVSGAAAIYLANNPGASPATVKAALIAGGDPAPCDTSSGQCTDDPDNIHEPMVLLAPFIVPPPTTPVDLSGTIKTAAGQDICAMVLASGQFMFSCNPTGVFALTDLPRETDGTVKRQIYADGFFPRIDVLTDSSLGEAVVMTGSGACPAYNTPYSHNEYPGSAGQWIDISGDVLDRNTQTPVCAMVLANGQHMFSCDGTGSYALRVPLDTNGQFKLQVYADGFAPTIQLFDEFSPDNTVRMAQATECQVP